MQFVQGLFTHYRIHALVILLVSSINVVLIKHEVRWQVRGPKRNQRFLICFLVFLTHFLIAEMLGAGQGWKSEASIL